MTAEKTGGNPLKKILIIIAALTLIAVLGTVLAFNNPFKETREIFQSNFSMDYNLSYEDPAKQILDVAMDINISKLSRDKSVYLVKELINGPITLCKGGDGTDVAYRDSGTLLAIGPIADGTKSVRLEYSVKVGESEADDWNGLTYTNGCLYEDLLVFTGENVLMLPMMDAEDALSPEKFVDSFSFKLETDKDWKAIMPFREALAGDSSFTLSKPDWNAFNTMGKSAFCFGYFEKSNMFGIADYYVDRGITGAVPESSMRLMMALTEFYANVFGETLGAYPFVLLRDNGADGSLILGGVGAASAAMSINMRMAEDCAVLSRTLYHAFFDSKVRAANLRFPPNNWLYKGLADFYVIASAAALPYELKESFSINAGESRELRYLRYLYFSLKEPGFLALGPASETNMYRAQEEYYMSTKVPVMIDLINYFIWQRDGSSDGLLKALVKNGARKSIDPDELLLETCGKDRESVRRYFSGDALIPNYADLGGEYALAKEDVLENLNYYEQLFAELFQGERVFYPFAQTVLLNEDAFRERATELDAHYNIPEIEAAVREFSPVLDRILLQYAVRCKLAGVDDMTALGIVEVINSEEAKAAWRSFVNDTGMESVRE